LCVRGKTNNTRNRRVKRPVKILTPTAMRIAALFQSQSSI